MKGSEMTTKIMFRDCSPQKYKYVILRITLLLLAINTSHCGKQAFAQLKHQLNFRAPVSKRPNQKWMRDCTGLHPRKSRVKANSKQKVGLHTYELSTVHLPSKRSHQESREQLLS